MLAAEASCNLLVFCVGVSFLYGSLVAASVLCFEAKEGPGRLSFRVAAREKPSPPRVLVGHVGKSV